MRTIITMIISVLAAFGQSTTVPDRSVKKDAAGNVAIGTLSVGIAGQPSSYDVAQGGCSAPEAGYDYRICWEGGTMKQTPPSGVPEPIGGSTTPASLWQSVQTRALSWAVTGGTMRTHGITLPFAVRTTTLSVWVSTADATGCGGAGCNVSFGLFAKNGTRVATTGAVKLSATGFTSLAWSGGEVVIPAGQYYFVMGSQTAGTAAIAQDGTVATFASNISLGALATGIVPATITPPADTWAAGNTPWVVLR
jgi:hypothetical protein